VRSNRLRQLASDASCCRIVVCHISIEHHLKASTCQNIHAQNFARCALGNDLERAAADFTIRREPLAGDARVNGRFKCLAAERALDFGEFFHAGNLAACGQSATLPAGGCFPVVFRFATFAKFRDSVRPFFNGFYETPG